WEKQKGSRGIRRGQWYRLVFQFPIRQDQFLCHSLLPCNISAGSGD
ncbi:RepA leader peptide Tap, partial [Klebsiella pneumoniae]|nr:RepA leader peptide Tap [Klebsiella pneumoniae]